MKERTAIRKYDTILMGVFFFFLFSAPIAKAQTQKKKPNIVFIFTDDHALRAISAYEPGLINTPNIDRIAREGMLFRHAMVTNSICGPSRAVILTGKYSHINGMPTNQNNMVFDGSQQTFPKLLQGAGYQTAIIGKWHLNSRPTGFDHWEVLPGQGEYYNPDFLTLAGRHRKQGYVTEIITNEAISWLKNKRQRDKPFLLMLQHKAPHRNWMPAEAHLDLFRGRRFPEPATLFDDYKGRASGARNQEMEIGEHQELLSDNKVFPSDDFDRLPGSFKRMDSLQRKVFYQAYKTENDSFLSVNLKGDDLVRWKYQRYIRDYLRTVASVDESIGTVLDYLKENGLEKNTIVVYSSDQGFYLGEHGWYDKRWMYEESLHMPLIVKWPGVVKAGTENRDLVLNLDFAETFLEAAGLPVPAAMQGKSLVPLLQGKKPASWRNEIYYHYTEFPQPHRVPRHFGIRDHRYKLICYYDLKEWEFFDLQKDPQELKSLYHDHAYAEKIKALKKRLKELQQQYKDPVGNW